MEGLTPFLLPRTLLKRTKEKNMKAEKNSIADVKVAITKEDLVALYAAQKASNPVLYAIKGKDAQLAAKIAKLEGRTFGVVAEPIKPFDPRGTLITEMAAVQAAEVAKENPVKKVKKVKKGATK